MRETGSDSETGSECERDRVWVWEGWGSEMGSECAKDGGWV